MLVHLCDLYMAPSVIPFINQVLQLVKFFYAQSYSKQKERKVWDTLGVFFVPVMLGGRLTMGCAREVEISKTKSPKTLLHADGLKS